jgi:hypothetical protein
MNNVYNQLIFTMLHRQVFQITKRITGTDPHRQTTGERTRAKCRIRYQSHVQALGQKRRNSEGNLALLRSLCAIENNV